MNNWLASDPRCFASALELKFFLEQFGPLTGRYHLSLPSKWRQDILDHYSQVGDWERKRIEVILQRAMDRAALYSRKVESWPDDRDWIINAKAFDGTNPGLLSTFIVPESPSED
ncbi:MAG: hypothetical protein DRQ56_00720, partial [Gammaproteobacteria bacterium]